MHTQSVESCTICCMGLYFMDTTYLVLNIYVVFFFVLEMFWSTVRQICRQCHHRFNGLPLRCPYAVLSRPSQEDVPRPCCWLMTTSVRYAGHSHWQNVKRIKAAKDNEMQKTIHTILRRIRVAVYGWFLQLLNMFDFICHFC